MPANIFEPTANGYAGRVRLFGIDEAIVLVAIEPGDGENTPAYRIQLDDEDGPDIGGAWKRVGERAGDYIALEVDSPLFPNPFRPVLFRADDAAPSAGEGDLAFARGLVREVVYDSLAAGARRDARPRPLQRPCRDPRWPQALHGVPRPGQSDSGLGG